MVAGAAAVDSANHYESRSVGEGNLWHYEGTGVQGTGLGVQDRSVEWNHDANNYHYDQLRVPMHPVHEWHQDDSNNKQDIQEWRPTYGGTSDHQEASAHSKESSMEQHSSQEWRSDSGHQDDVGSKHEDKHHHHHYHHHVKVVEVPKPFPVHVEKPYPVYVEKPVIVEKHVPLKFYIKKKYH
ncbi:uncharacterized protein LOC131433916 [Malaya genurostris]|uniref:uncharacterized protein LOC131433916 n=1 Tax=Malaya genurostris TaxID=325434 RepID=UPI0026F3E95A|nr:uncharacterized protein LOC131433916 [Malaya genurostris]